MKTLRLYISSFMLLFVIKSNAQNIVPDSHFDLMTTRSCHIPVDAMNYMQHWYPASGTPDIFMRGCNDLFNAWYLWYREVEPNSFGSIGGAMMISGRIGSEVIATPFIDTVKTGRYYHFEFKTRNQGIWHQNGNPIHCVTNPVKSLDIYLSDQRITFQDNDDLAIVTGEKVLSFTDEIIQDSAKVHDWTQFKVCLEGRDSWQHLAISLPTAYFTTSPPCVIDTMSYDIFNHFQYDLDEVYFVGFPEEQTIELLLCKERGKVDYDASDLFEHYLAIENSEVIWQDGSTDLQYTFTEGGEYQMDIIVECGIIPIKFNVIEKYCNPVVFVPTGFSPNYDGINDELFPYFKADFPVQNYEFMVFDRWGNIFYRSSVNDGFTGWDGKVNGKEAAIGTYVWTVTFEMLDENGEWKSHQLSGDTLLMR